MDQKDQKKLEDRLFKRSKNKIAASAFAYQTMKMLVAGQGYASIIKFLEERGLTVSKGSLYNFITEFVKPLSEEDRYIITNDIRQQHGVIGAAATDDTDLTMDQVLRQTLKGVARRIQGLENFAGSLTQLNSELEKLLVQYYSLRVELRKKLQEEWQASETGVARRKAISDIGKLALDFIPLEKQSEFFDKLQDYQDGDLENGPDAVKKEAYK